MKIILYSWIILPCLGQQRHLFDPGCPGRVNACRAELGLHKLPYEDWLQGVPEGSDIHNLIQAAQAIDMVDFAQNAQIADADALHEVQSKTNQALESSDPAQQVPAILQLTNRIFFVDFFGIFATLLGLLSTAIMALIVVVPYSSCVASMGSDEIFCLLMGAVLVFVSILVASPVLVPTLLFALLSFLMNLLLGGGVQEDPLVCHGQELQCQLDTVMHYVVPLLLERSPDGSFALVPQP